MLLDTFTILFKSDASPLEDGLDKSRQTTDELVNSMRRAESQVDKANVAMGQAARAGSQAMAQTAAATGDAARKADDLADSMREAGKSSDGLGADMARLNTELAKTDGLAGKAGGSLGAVLKSMAGLAAGFFAAGAAGAKFSETVAELETIGRTADSLNLPVEDVDAFSRSMVAMGGDAQGARDSLVDMAESIGEAVQDVESGRAKVYKQLGISLKDVNGQAITATEGMLRLSDAVAGMSKEEAIFRIKELGITDNRTVELILKGRKEMERMLKVQKEQSGVTKESVENARKYQEAMSRLNNAQDSITTQMAAALIPALTKVIEWVAKGVEWMRENKQTVVAFFGAIAAVVAMVYLPAMVSAAAATLAATWPLILLGAIVTAAAAAFALLYDDIQNFLAGNDSLIGQISEKYPVVGETIKAVAEAIGAAWEGVKTYISDLWEALQPLGAAFSEVFGAIGGTVSAFLSLLGNVVAKIGSILGVEMTGSFKSLGTMIGGVMDGIVSVIKAAVSYITSALKLVTGAINGVGSAVSTVAGWIGFGDDEEQKNDSRNPQGSEATQPEGTVNGKQVSPDVPTMRKGASTGRGGGSKNDHSSAKDVEAYVQTGNKMMSQANASPLNAVSSGAISNSVATTNKETNIQVGEVIVNTQATDAEGVANGVAGSLESQLAQVDSEFSTGRQR